LIFISDIHHGLSGLDKLPANKGPIVILGDLINWIDYRNGSGIAKNIFGEEKISKLITYRKNHDYSSRKNLWEELFSNDPEAIQLKIEKEIVKQYEQVFGKLKQYEVWVIPGNVDSVSAMENAAGSNVKFVDSTIIEHEGYKFGFAGGGVPTPINARGELTEEEFDKKLSRLKGVDIICTHAPPLVNELATDVITNRLEQGWSSLANFLLENKPLYSLFGDVHQPKATSWIYGETYCVNVGYNRATKKYIDFKKLINV